MIFVVLVVLAVITMVTLPFFFAKENLLQEGASVNSIEKLERIKQSLLKRYLEDQAAFEEKRISESIWAKRKHFLTTRYMDAARREDYLKFLNSEQKNEG